MSNSGKMPLLLDSSVFFFLEKESRRPTGTAHRGCQGHLTLQEHGYERT